MGWVLIEKYEKIVVHNKGALKWTGKRCFDKGFYYNIDENQNYHYDDLDCDWLGRWNGIHSRMAESVNV